MFAKPGAPAPGFSSLDAWVWRAIEQAMEMQFIARFHVRPEARAEAHAAIAEVGAATKAEAGCLEYRALQTLSDPEAFVIVSRWRDEAAFDRHAEFDHTRRFIETMTALADRPPEFLRCEAIR
jgi:quinol monooxygenase YgiN